MLLVGAYNLNIPEMIFLNAVFLLIAGESLLLFVGMNWPKPGKWSTPLNVLLALSDITGSFYLLIFQFQVSVLVFWLLTGFLTIGHLFRVLQYAFKWGRPFCSNFPLFVLNLVRLGGIIVALVIILL